jgi:Uma2 family endonuclease
MFGLNFFSSNRQTNPFEDFVRKHGSDTEVELIDGAVVERMSQHLEAEKLRVWLHWLLEEYLKATGLGVLADTTIPIAVNTRRARRASIAFVAAERTGIIRNHAIYGAPDLVIDIISPNALFTELSVREGDYRTIEVPEIVFLDPVRRLARVLRRRGREYEEEKLTEVGTLNLAMLDGIALPMGEMMREPRTPVGDMVRRVLGSAV